MKKIQMFLASSINEFKNYRNEIGDFIRKVQNVLIDYDIRVALFECEFFDISIAAGRKQDEYNEEIKKSDVFLMLIGKRIGGYTLEEYRTAVNNNVPAIHVLFQDVEYDESVTNLKKEMENNQTKHFTFKELPEAYCYMAQILRDVLKDDIDILVDNDKMRINGKEIKF